MSFAKLVVMGASVFPEIAEIVRDINRLRPTYELFGVLDDNPAVHGTAVEAVPVLGPLETASQLPAETRFVLGISSYRARLAKSQIIKRIGLPAERYETLVHPLAKVYSTARLGRGCVVFPGAVIFAGSVLEDFVTVLANTVIGFNNRVCEGASVAALVSTTAHVILGHYCHIGTSSAIAEGVAVGAGAQVAMATLVARDVPCGAFVIGNPPRILDRVEVPAELVQRWEAVVARR